MKPVLKVFLKDGATLPTYAHEGDSGLDLISPRDAVLSPLEPVFIDTGVCVEIPEGYEGQIRGRSSLNKRGVIVPTGTVDSPYRGSLGVILIYLSTTAGGEPYVIKAGDKIAQLVIAPVARVETLQVQNLSELSDTERGEKGWGSSGK